MGKRRLSDASPKIIFWSEDINASYPKIEPASANRDWMHKTYNKLAYKCTPLLEAMLNGWEIKLPQDVIVRWNGLSEGIAGENPDNVSIISGEFYEDIKIVSLDAGIGTVTFLFNLIAETDEDHYLTISGPPNYIFKDAEPLTGLLRSSRFTDHPLQLTWKITSPNTEIIFPKGMPICFISMHKRNLMESTDIEIKQIDKDKDNKFIKYTKMRSSYFKDHESYEFPQFYKNGINENGEKVLNSIKKIVLKPIKYIKDN
jgi:hypothetical protein